MKFFSGRSARGLLNEEIRFAASRPPGQTQQYSLDCCCSVYEGIIYILHTRMPNVLVKAHASPNVRQQCPVARCRVVGTHVPVGMQLATSA